MLQVARILLALAAMLYASYQDWRYREVGDRVWLVSGSLAVILTGLDLWLNWGISKFFLTFISIGLTAGLGFLFYFLGLYGGADAKAIAILALALPLYWDVPGFHPFTGLAALTNGLLLSLALPAGILVYNLMQVSRGKRLFEGFERESAARKAAALMLGIRLNDATRRRFWFPMEEVKNGARRFKFNLLSLELERLERDDLWATPGIPLLVFITAGFAAYILLGDLAYLALTGLGILPA